MALLRAAAIAAAILLFSGFCELGDADTLVMRNQMRSKGVLQVACQSVIAHWPWHTIPFGENYTVQLPLGAMVDLVPAHCTGKWSKVKEGGDGIRFATYTYFRDHQKCRESCWMEARDGRWYTRNATSRKWQPVLQFQN